MERVNRRLAAVMVTDIVGFTRLAQEDERRALDLLTAHQGLLRPVFSSHNGREIRVTGDGFVVEFPSALDAVHCAVAVQRALRATPSTVEHERVTVRIGLHVGEVVETEEDLLGDAVDVALAVEPFAPSGGICLTRQIYEQVWNKLDAPPERHGEHHIEGYPAPLQLFTLPLRERSPDDPASPKLEPLRVAVLPLNNISPDPRDRYLSDGLTEEIIHTLAKIAELRLIAHTSVGKYRDASHSVADIGRELAVGTLLTGSVRVAGERLRVTLQMVDVSTEESVWSEAYDRTLEDVFEIQTDIAHRVAEALRVHLLPEEEEEIAKEPTSSLEAYTEYLKGRYYWNTWEAESLNQAIEHFERALASDRGLALAHSGLADTYSLMAHLGFLEPEEAYRKAEASAREALLLDESLAEAHTSLAVLQIVFGGDAERAEAELRRAIELNPSCALAHHWYAVLLAATGRAAESDRVREVALELDPDAPVFHAAMGQLLGDDRQEPEEPVGSSAS
jgi:adenylate cyclase